MVVSHCYVQRTEDSSASQLTQQVINSWQRNESQYTFCFGGQIRDLWKECIEGAVVNAHTLLGRMSWNGFLGHNDNGTGPRTNTLFNHGGLL